MRVFLIEDILTVRSIVPDMLCRLGGLQLVARAKGQVQARAWLEAHADAWDLVVVDLVLDGWWCSDVIGCARSLHPAGRLVVFSSMTAPEVRARCMAAGADATFPKMHVGDFAAWVDAQVRIPALIPLRPGVDVGTMAPSLPLRAADARAREWGKR